MPKKFKDYANELDKVDNLKSVLGLDAEGNVVSQETSVPTKTSDLTNDIGFCDVVTATSEADLPTERKPNTLYAVVEA